MKLRTFHFRRGMNMSNFVTDLRNIINEFYNINDVKAVNLIAISHVTTSLDEELREPIRILQLSGTATLEDILELIQSKQRQHSFSSEIPVASSTNTDSNNCLNRLEKLVEGLTNTVQKLTTSSNAAFAQPTSSTAMISKKTETHACVSALRMKCMLSPVISLFPTSIPAMSESFTKALRMTLTYICLVRSLLSYLPTVYP